jgi:hypothetical protein
MPRAPQLRAADLRRRPRQIAARRRLEAHCPQHSSAGHISTAIRVIGLSTGGVTQANPARANGCGYAAQLRRARLRALASSYVLVSSTAELILASQGLRRSQSLAAEVSSLRLANLLRAPITQRSPRSQPTSVKITGRAIGTVSSLRLASAKLRQVSSTSRNRWSGGQCRMRHVRNAFAARS